jgi:hypothetical protein
MAFNTNVAISFVFPPGVAPEMTPPEFTVTPAGNPDIAAYVTLPAPCVATTVRLNASPL